MQLSRCREAEAAITQHRETTRGNSIEGVEGERSILQTLRAASPGPRHFSSRSDFLNLLTCTERVAPGCSCGRSLLRHASDVRERRSLFGLHCDAMLRAGHAPVWYRGARVGCNCVERHVVNSLGASARAWRLQPPLGFRCALRRCSLRVPVPHLALRARRESLPGAWLRVRSQEKRAAEVRLALWSSVLSSYEGLSRRRRRRLALPSRCG